MEISARSAEDAPVVLVWHPAISAIAWVWRWALWSLPVAVGWEALSRGLTPTLHLGAISAHAVAVLGALALGWLLVVLGHDLLSLRRALLKGASAEALVRLAIMAVYGLACGGALAWVAHLLEGPLAELRGAWRVPLPPGPLSEVVCAVVAVLAIALLWRVAPTSLQVHRTVLRLAGWRYLGAGYALMALVRLRQNRADFFRQAPLISKLPLLAIAVGVHSLAGGVVGAWVLPAVIVLLAAETSAADLCPPLWLLLGRSSFDTHHLYTTLRFSWYVGGVNLLDRSNDEWLAYYQHWHRSWMRSGVKFLPYNPNMSRVWSLRPRGDLWMATVWNLMRFTRAIIIDGRVASRHIDDEILWAAEFGVVGKVWIVAGEDGSAPALDSALRWAAEDHVTLPPGSAEALYARVVPLDRLKAGAWSAAGLDVLARAPGS